MPSVVLTRADVKTLKLLDSKARSLEAAKLLVEGEGPCRERAEAALEEAAAILRDAIGNVKRQPNVVGPRDER